MRERLKGSMESAGELCVEDKVQHNINTKLTDKLTEQLMETERNKASSNGTLTKS